SAVFRETWRRLGISNDDFIRTTEARHERVVQRILQALWDAGEIYLGTYGGQYCFGCERFYTEKEIVDGKCPDHLTPLTWIEEENYILKPHAVYWPCMLKAAGLPLYHRLNVHGYWTVEGQKMSKSLGNVIEPVAFAAKFGPVGNDVFRYFVMRENVFGLDSDFSETAV